MSQRPVAKVFRAAKRNDDGDPVDDDGHVIRTTDGNLLVGEIKGIIFGGQSASPTLAREESSDTTSMLGIPNRKNGIKVKFGDRLVIDSVTYQVTSRPQWDYPQHFSGTPPQFHWVNVEARYN